MTSLIKHCFPCCMCIADVDKQGPAGLGLFAWGNEAHLVQLHVYVFVLGIPNTPFFNTLLTSSWPGGGGSSCQPPPKTERLKCYHHPTCGVPAEFKTEGSPEDQRGQLLLSAGSSRWGSLWLRIAKFWASSWTKIPKPLWKPAWVSDDDEK